MLTNLGLALLAILAGLLPLTFAGSGTCDAADCVLSIILNAIENQVNPQPKSRQWYSQP